MGKVYYGGPNRREIEGFEYIKEKDGTYKEVNCYPKDGGKAFLMDVKEFKLVYSEYHWGDGFNKKL
jgi:hypothetical protein